PGGAACGVDSSDTDDAAPVVPPTTAPCTPPGESDGSTGGAVGADDDELPPCDEGGDTSTTTEADEPTTTTEPEDEPTEEEPTEDAPPDEDAYVESMVAALEGREDFGLPMDREQAECIGPRWIDALGVERMAEAGLDPEGLDGEDPDGVFDELVGRPEASDMVDALTDCGLDLERAFFEGLSDDGSIRADQVDCLVDALPDGTVEQILVVSLADGEEGLDAEPGLGDPLTEAAAACP
ncbi:MAG TPA: hypothetical protein VHK88_03615, partial [Aquihabitans sp.]|nr:hypothetical protein [Aquihabitans sp.]